MIERAGGRVLTKAVAEILVEKGRAVGVRMEKWRSTQSSACYRAAGLHTIPTALCLPESVGVRHRLPQRLTHFQQAIAHVGLYVGLKSNQALGVGNANQWVYRGYDHDAEMAKFQQSPNTNFPRSTFHAKDPAWTKTSRARH